MSLTLSTEDLRLLHAAQQAVLSPMRHDAPRGWAQDVVERVAPLLGADSGSFYVALAEAPDEPLASMLNLSPTTIDAYTEYYQERELLPPVSEPMVAYLPELVPREVLEASEIYNDFWKPTQQFDNLAMITPLGCGGQAGMFFHHARESGERFGERGRRVLELLLPAMEAGVEDYAQWSRRHGKFLRFLDRMADGLLVCDPTGRVLHANPGLAGVLEGDPEADRVRGEAEALARRMASLLRGIELLEADPAAPAPVGVTTDAGSYRIRGNYLTDPAVGGPGILITVRGSRVRLPSAGAIRERFGLTNRQAEVALLLAERKTNDEVAELLFISPHTARRHTESVFMKVGVASRLDVRSALLG